MKRCIEIVFELAKELRVPANRQTDVLLVEDNEPDAIIGKRALDLAGCRVTIATSGRQALDLYRDKMSRPFVVEGRSQHPYDIVFLDLKLPDIHGLDVMRHMKLLWPSQPVVILTGTGTARDLEYAGKLGYHGWIEKPLRKEGVREALEAHNLIYAGPKNGLPSSPMPE